MDGHFNSSPLHNGERQDSVIAPDNYGLAASSSPKRSRRSVQKRVVSVPIGEVDKSRVIKGSGEGAPPSDSWAWRKYGQKPIKGSPYPRGYYRCSSSKGCPARKQVERSRVDPTMLVVTYAAEHNHPHPLPRNHRHHHHNPKPQPVENPTPIHTDPAENFPDPISGDGSSLFLIPEEFHWFSDVGSNSSSHSPPEAIDTFFYRPIAAVVATALPEIGGGVEEEDSLFADLGELPECSVVFRRGFLEHGEEDRRSRLTSASG